MIEKIFNSNTFDDIAKNKVNILATLLGIH